MLLNTFRLQNFAGLHGYNYVTTKSIYMFTALDSYETKEMGPSFFGPIKAQKYSTLTEVATYEVIQLCKELKGFIPFKIRMIGNSRDRVNVFKKEGIVTTLHIPKHILNPQKCLPPCYPEVD
jgi:hypothetical protein